MGRVKKISEKQFVLDCVAKEFELVGKPINWNTFDDLKNWADINQNWFNKHEFSEKQYNQFKDYFLEHFYDWQPKRVSRKTAEKEFSWFSFTYGFPVAKKISLPNRETKDLYLVKEEDYWTLEGPKVYCENIRVIFDSPDNAVAIDPPGGPFMSIGDVYSGKKIVKFDVTKGIKVYLEDETN